MIIVDFVAQSDCWPDLSGVKPKIKRAIQTAHELCAIDLPDQSEVALVLSDDASVQELNAKWRDQDKPTNVLSFANNEGKVTWSPLLGDIVLAYETIDREADEQSKPFDHHLIHLCVHGFLHLVGYDHVEDAKAVEMERLETQILAELKIPDPYTSVND